MFFSWVFNVLVVACAAGLKGELLFIALEQHFSCKLLVFGYCLLHIIRVLLLYFLFLFFDLFVWVKFLEFSQLADKQD